MNDKSIVIIGAGIGGLSTGVLLVNKKIKVEIFEKSKKVGGRTSSVTFRNHILDNGFHIMPFYKKSAIYDVMKKANIESSPRVAAGLLAVAESHRQGGAWIQFPVANRDLYVFHV